MAYAFILTHPGYPCVFWHDYFEQGLGRPGIPRGIAALVAAHEATAGGGAIVRYVDDDLYVMERAGWQSRPGLVFVLNNRGEGWGGAYVDTSRASTAYRPVAWSGRDDATPQPTAAAADGRGRSRPPRAGCAITSPRGEADPSPAEPAARRPLPACAGRGAETDPLRSLARADDEGPHPVRSLLPACGEKARIGVDGRITPRHGAATPGPAGGRPPAADAAIRAPGPGQLLLRVAACAVCRTDLQLCEGDLAARRLPIVPGHQAVGRVAAVGAGRRGWREGDRAGVDWLAGADGTCGHCRAGRENLCERAAFTGWDVDGGFAEQLVVRADYAARLPEGFDDVAAARCCAAG